MSALPQSSALAATLLFFCTNVEAQVREYIANGDFELGAVGWRYDDSGRVRGPSGETIVNDGTVPIGPSGVTYAPQSGTYDFTLSTQGNGVREIFQTWPIPGMISNATLSWTDEIRNLAPAFLDPAQEFRVILTDINGVQVGPEIFSTNPGDALVQPSTNRSFDVTTAIRALTGRVGSIRFVLEDQLGPFPVSIDNVSLLIDSPALVQRSRANGVTLAGDPGCNPAPTTNTSTLFTPDGAGGYQMTPNAGVAFPQFTTGNPLLFGDDSTQVVPTGFPFTMPGGNVVNLIKIDSNGRVFEAGLVGSDPTESVAELLGDISSIIAPMWVDLDPSAGGQIWRSTGLGGEFVLTWDDVPEFGSDRGNTFQLILAPDGSITFNYLDIAIDDGIVGVSEGRGVSNPGSVDLSAGPLTTTGSAVLYQSFQGDNDFNDPYPLPNLLSLNTPRTNLSYRIAIGNNAGSVAEVYVIGFANQPSVALLGTTCWLAFRPNGAALGTFTGVPGDPFSIQIPDRPSLVGTTFAAQGAIFDPAVNNALSILLTNRIEFIIGS
ncbi:MAG: hypothetical protein AAF196_18300 [Planctomycetota bacterium]